MLEQWAAHNPQCRASFRELGLTQVRLQVAIDPIWQFLTSTENMKESERAGEVTNLMRILSAPRGVTTVAGANA